MKRSFIALVIIVAIFTMYTTLFAGDPVKIHVKVPSTKAHGKALDVFGNPPDIWIKITHEKIGEVSNQVFKDTFEARAVFYLNELTDEDEISITIWDKDMRNHDLMGE